MIDESRFQRLEDKVDDVKTEVNQIHVDMRLHMANIQEHIAGDKKIIDKLIPVLDKLPDIVELAQEHQFQKRFKKKAYKVFGITATIIGILAGISRIL